MSCHNSLPAKVNRINAGMRLESDLQRRRRQRGRGQAYLFSCGDFLKRVACTRQSTVRSLCPTGSGQLASSEGRCCGIRKSWKSLELGRSKIGGSIRARRVKVVVIAWMDNNNKILKLLTSLGCVNCFQDIARFSWRL